MASSRLICLLILGAAAGACGGGNPPPAGGGGDAGIVNGTERIGWSQQAEDAATLATFHFLVYIDGNRTDLNGVSCATTAGPAGFDCSAPLPAMAPGAHVLEIASYVVSDGLLESGKSAPLRLTVSGAITGPAITGGASSTAPSAAPPASRQIETSDGLRLQVDVVARQLERPTAIAVMPDGALLIGDASGRIAAARGGAVNPTPALAIADAGSGTGGGVLDVELDPQFERNHFVYVLDVSAGDRPAFRLARFRAAADRLGERAVLLGGIPASPVAPSGALAFAPDGTLLVALDDGGDGRASRLASSLNGKVLRLNPDGSTPRDQPSGSPVYGGTLRSPRSLDWDPVGGALWVADPGVERVDRLRPEAPARIAATSFQLPLDSGAGSALVYRGDAVAALRGDLLAAPAGEGGYLLRAKFDGAAQERIVSTERLIIDGASQVRVLDVGPDGAIYVGTESEVLRISASR